MPSYAYILGGYVAVGLLLSFMGPLAEQLRGELTELHYDTRCTPLKKYLFIATLVLVIALAYPLLMFDFFKKKSKTEFIKELIQFRIDTDDALKTYENYDRNCLDTVDEVSLLGMPEASIVWIVEAYVLSLKAGATARQIFDLLESVRSQNGFGQMPEVLNLNSYVKYRIEIEHQFGSRISDYYIQRAIDLSMKYFGK